MKKGITAITAAIIVVIIIILLGTITITSYNSVQNANKLVFTLEISNIQEEVTKYYKLSSDNEYPIEGNTYTINLTQITSETLIQFEGETKDANGQITLYEVDLSVLAITDNKYGNKDNEKDVYVVSKETGRVYYLQGVKYANKTYYTLTEDLIAIKERNEKEDEEIADSASPHIATKGAVTKVLTSGEKEEYIADIKVTGADVVKYEIGIISEKNAKEYFKNNGKTLVGDRIKIEPDTTITLYAENSKGEYEIKYRGYPIIPKGFTVSGIDGETDVQQGLVIYDGTALVTDADSDSNGFIDAQETRNQFVWVPVQDISEFERRDGYQDGKAQTLVSKNTATEPYSYSDLITEITDQTREWAEYRAMYASVEKYGGFYIARYEAGDGTTTSRRTTYSEAHTVVSVKNEFVYNFVGWGNSMTDVDSDIVVDDVNKGKGAVYLSRNMSLQNKTNIVSTLIYGVQWDAVMNFMKDIENPYGTLSNYFIYDSTNMGYEKDNASKNSLHKTGIDLLDDDGNILNRQKNIYDIAGNMYEWTMEAHQSQSRNCRGGSYYFSTAIYPASNRASATVAYCVSAYGFRVALYLTNI